MFMGSYAVVSYDRRNDFPFLAMPSSSAYTLASSTHRAELSRGKAHRLPAVRRDRLICSAGQLSWCLLITH